MIKNATLAKYKSVSENSFKKDQLVNQSSVLDSYLLNLITLCLKVPCNTVNVFIMLSLTKLNQLALSKRWM